MLSQWRHASGMASQIAGKSTKLIGLFGLAPTTAPTVRITAVWEELTSHLATKRFPAQLPSLCKEFHASRHRILCLYIYIENEI